MKRYRRKRQVRMLYRQHKQEMRMAVDLLRAGFKPAAVPELIRRFRRYAY